MSDDAFDWLDAPIERVGSLDVPMPYASNLVGCGLSVAPGPGEFL